MSAPTELQGADAEALITSNDRKHPANLICELCRKFYTLGWVTGTGGGISIRHDHLVYIAPSGVQKELLEPQNMFVMDFTSQQYLRKPLTLKPSQCTPLFMESFKRGAGACIHTHSQWAVLVTLLVETLPDQIQRKKDGLHQTFEITNQEMIKGIPKGREKAGYLGFFDKLVIPVIENTAHEEDLTEFLSEAIDKFPDTYAVLVRRHGVYIWGDNPDKAKTQAECFDYLFQVAVEMHKCGIPWLSK